MCRDRGRAEGGRAAAFRLLAELQATRLAFVDRLERLKALGPVPPLGEIRRVVALFFKLRRLNGEAERLRRERAAGPSDGPFG